MAQCMCSAIAVKNWHLNIHKNNMGLRMVGIVLFKKIIQSLLPVPDSTDGKSKLFDSLTRYPGYYCTLFFVSVIVDTTIRETYLSSTTSTWKLSRSAFEIVKFRSDDASKNGWPVLPNADSSEGL